MPINYLKIFHMLLIPPYIVHLPLYPSKLLHVIFLVSLLLFLLFFIFFELSSIIPMVTTRRVLRINAGKRLATPLTNHSFVEKLELHSTIEVLALPRDGDIYSGENIPPN